jgi:hypothetical protein
MAVIDCICPGTPHPEGDTVTLHSTVSFRVAMTMQKAVVVARTERDDDMDTAEILAILAESYVRHGIASWTVVDAAGKPVPVSPASVDTYLLPHIDQAMEVAEEADDLYQEAVLLPLLKRGSRSSQPTPTTDSMSPSTGSEPEAPTPSKPSSTTTTPTDATGMTSSSPDGASSSSPSLVSVV